MGLGWVKYLALSQGHLENVEVVCEYRLERMQNLRPDRFGAVFFRDGNPIVNLKGYLKIAHINHICCILNLFYLWVISSLQER